MDDWPALPYDDWRDTRDTLHMYTQIIGKIRLALSPFEPQWANVPLYVNTRGLTTSPVPDGLRTFDVELDLVDHRLVVRASDGGIEEFPLRPRAVADFYEDVMGALGRLGIDVTISPGPSEVPDPIPFAEDRVHHSYEPADAKRFFHVLSQVDVVLKEHRSKFNGKAPPVHFFWGSFDLVGTRFSGRPAAPPSRFVVASGLVIPGSPAPPSSPTAIPSPTGSNRRRSDLREQVGTLRSASSCCRTKRCGRRPIHDGRCWSFSRAPTTRARRGWAGDR